MGVFGKTSLGILNYAKDQMVISGDSKYEFIFIFVERNERIHI